MLKLRKHFNESINRFIRSPIRFLCFDKSPRFIRRVHREISNSRRVWQSIEVRHQFNVYLISLGCLFSFFIGPGGIDVDQRDEESRPVRAAFESRLNFFVISKSRDESGKSERHPRAM